MTNDKHTQSQKEDQVMPEREQTENTAGGDIVSIVSMAQDASKSQDTQDDARAKTDEALSAMASADSGDIPCAPRHFKGRHILLVLLMMVCGFLFVETMEYITLETGMALTMVIFLVSARLWLCVPGRRPSMASDGVFVVLLALSASFGIFALPEMVVGPLFLMLFVSLPYWLVLVAGVQQPPSLARNVINDTLHAAIIVPYTRGSKIIHNMKRTSSTKSQTPYIIGGLAILFPLMMIVGALLSSADDRFGRLMRTMFVMIESLWSDSFGKFIISICVGLYLYLTVSGIHAGKRSVPREQLSLRGMPVMVTSVVLIGVCTMYVVFCGVQVMNIYDVLGSSPSASFLSRYARDGFFELNAVVIINLCIVVVAQVFTREQSPMLRMLKAVLCVLTLVLILTACFKMGLYIHHFGYTLLRVYTMWFMGVLFLLFAMLLVYCFVSFPIFPSALCICIVLFTAMAYANVGGLVASRNVSRYLSGSLETFDIEQYDEFAYAATPHLIRLAEETEDAELRTNVDHLLRYDASYRAGERPWMNDTLQRRRAGQLREAYIDKSIGAASAASK